MEGMHVLILPALSQIQRHATVLPAVRGEAPHTHAQSREGGGFIGALATRWCAVRDLSCVGGAVAGAAHDRRA